MRLEERVKSVSVLLRFCLKKDCKFKRDIIYTHIFVEIYFSVSYVTLRAIVLAFTFGVRAVVQQVRSCIKNRDCQFAFDFSPDVNNAYLNLHPLKDEEIEDDEMLDVLSIDDLADFLTEGTLSMKSLTTWSLSLCKAALVTNAAYNWLSSSHKNHVSVERIRLTYKTYHVI